VQKEGLVEIREDYVEENSWEKYSKSGKSLASQPFHQ